MQALYDSPNRDQTVPPVESLWGNSLVRLSLGHVHIVICPVEFVHPRNQEVMRKAHFLVALSPRSAPSHPEQRRETHLLLCVLQLLL
jgi:hypothetical protein